MPFDLQPHLVGDLLELRPLRPGDFDALYAVASDPLIWEQHPARDRWRREVFREFSQRGLDSGGAFAVIDRADGGIIGSSRYFAYSEEARDVEIGWTFLARSYWGGRYNTEMKRLMLDHAFRFVDRVYFIVGPGNVRSQRAVGRLGAVRAGERPDHYGTRSLVFALGSDQWRRRMSASHHVVESRRVPRIGPYSQAVRVGNIVYTAGQPGIDPATGQAAGPTFDAQARQAFANLRMVLEDAGSGLERVVKVTCFVTDAAAFATLNQLFTEFFPQNPPVRSTPVVALPKGLLFSIDAVAVAE